MKVDYFYVHLIHITCFIGLCIADFACVCSYTDDVTIYSNTDTASAKRGKLNNWECKQLLAVPVAHNWMPLAHIHQVGYVEKDSKIVLQMCTGEPPVADAMAPVKPKGRPGDTCCSNRWLVYEGSCYWFSDEISLDWTAATHYCASHDDSNLVVLDSKDEEMMLRDQARHLFKQNRSQALFWIGATDADNEGDWIWYPTRERVANGYQNWAPGQPQNFDRLNQDCGCLWGASDFSWEDYHCDRMGHVICEKNFTRKTDIAIIG